MKTCFVLLLTLFFFLPMLLAQDTTALCPKKTFVIRKSNLSNSVNNEAVVAAPLEREKAPISFVEEEDNLLIEQKKDNLTSNNIAKKPTLAGGEFGLMNISPYEEETDLKNWNFVILQYSVSVYGWATKVEIIKTNNAFLKSIVLEKLRQSKWNPAIDKDGEAIEYRMYPQIVIVKDRINEEDYYDD